MSSLAPALPSADELLDLMPSGQVVTGPDGVVLRANATFCRWLGYDAADLVGLRRMADLLTRAARVFHQSHWALALEGQGSLTEFKLDLQHRDGHAVPMLVNAVRRRLGDRPVDLWSLVIVTDRQRFEQALHTARRDAETAAAGQAGAQRALAQSQEVLGLAIRGARMGAWSRDLVTDALWWSREME